MQNFFSTLFEPSTFSPHGFCLLWEPGLIWLHAVSDGLIALAYFSIPLALVRFLRQRPDFEFGWVLGLFALFIMACGATHIFAVVTLWTPLYWLDGAVKALTAVVSVATAILLWPLLPRVVALPSPAALRLVNHELSVQLQERDRDAAVLREREAQLRQMQKMEGLGQLAGGIAHDFNNVLQVVSSGLSLIQRRAGDEGAVRKLAGMAADAAARGASITGRLLTFARKGELQSAPLNPRACLEGVCEMLAHTLGAGIVVQTDVADDAPPFMADQAQLETVLVNLAVNARDAMPDGGCIKLSAAPETVVGELANKPGLAPGHYVRLTMADSGNGMSEETLARAGEPFFTTKPVGQGTGLGLAMARGFAEQSGGRFLISSALGQGTKISLWLPVAGASAIDLAAPPSAALDVRPPGSVRAMLVDDDERVREMLSGHLQAGGYDVYPAADGLEALAKLDAGTAVDLLVTDFAMPGMNGLVLIEEARKRLPHLPVLLLTGYADAEVRERIELGLSGVVEMMRKPVTGEELADRVARLLDTSVDHSR